ncbi:MAG: hypothetical protein CMJ31_12980 [Phycisphaerae bacterium]|nr:hypothetical protein [Phycisphaerae bacterium]
MTSAATLIAWATTALAVTTTATAQEEPPPPILEALPDEAVAKRPEINAALERLLDASYLSDDERLALRLRHGLWEDADLADPVARATAAAIAGAWESAALDDPAVPVALRAETLLERGQPAEALELALNDITPTAARVRTEALVQLGRFDEAIDEATRLADRAREENFNAAETAELVRSLMIRRRLAGPNLVGGRDDANLLGVLKQAREQTDPLSWPVRVVEAELLFERHSFEDAAAALVEALALNPRCADAYAMLGLMAVNSFNLEGAREIADKLDEIAGAFGVSSIDADLVRVRAALRQDSADVALDVISSLRERLPGRRDAIAWHASAHAAAFHEDATDALLDELDALAPATPLGYATVGATLAEQRQYDDARRYLEIATARAPNWAEPWADLGLLEIQAGRDDAAADALRRSLDLDAFDQRAKNSLALVEGLAPWPIIESEHFRVRAQPGVDELLASEMLPVLEDIYDRVAGDRGFDHSLEGKTLIELMPSHRWFSVRISGMTRIHTMAASTGPVIAMESPREGPGMSRGPFDWPRVLQHEFAHTVTLARTNNRIPHWFTEAAAVYVEDAPRDHDTWTLLLRAFESETLFDLDQINVAFVRPKKPTDRSQAYAQGHWMYQFIAERFGEEAPLRLMDRYAAGENEAAAFEAELGLDRDAFMNTFTAWAERQLRDARLLPPAGTPTLRELVDEAKREHAHSDDGNEDANNENNDAADDFEVTLETVNAWLETYPDHPQLLGLAVDLEVDALGDADARPARLPERIVELLERAESARPTDDLPRRLLARHLLASDDETEQRAAAPRLAFLDEREQSASVYADRLAMFYAELGDADRAMAKANRAALIDPFDADVREQAARVALVTGNLAEAERHIVALTRIEPESELHRRRLEVVRGRMTE